MVSTIRGNNRAIHPQSYFTASLEVSGASCVAASALVETVLRMLLDDDRVIAMALTARYLESERAVGVGWRQLAIDYLAAERSAPLAQAA